MSESLNELSEILYLADDICTEFRVYEGDNARVMKIEVLIGQARNILCQIAPRNYMGSPQEAAKECSGNE